MSKFSYLDIGAHDPFIISNTGLFYEKGCRGINVDADPVRIKRFIEARPEDKNINIGIGTEEGTFPFYSVGDICSLKIEEIQWWIDKWGTKEEIKRQEIHVIKLEHLIRDYCYGEFPDYMSMDIEGKDYEVLKDCDLSSNGPLVLTVETAIRDYYDLNNEKMIALLSNMKYEPIVKFGSNITFARKDIFYKAAYGM